MASSRSLPRNAACAIVLVLWLAGGCAKPGAELDLRGDTEKARSLFVVNHGWHSALVINKADIGERSLPEIRDFPDAEYLEFGWGDWDYYQASDPGLSLALKAAFWSGRSVLHVTGFNGAVEGYFRGSEVVEIALSDEALQRIVQFVAGTFLRADPAQPVEARPGLRPNSRFYSARGRFHLLRTCNTWVAEALRSGGLPFSPAYTITAGSLSDQAKRFGVVREDR